MKIPFFRSYKDGEKTLFLNHLKYLFIISVIFSTSIYAPSLVKFKGKITIYDWPLPQNNARNASTLYSTSEEKKELFTFFDENFKSYLPTFMDLLIFYLSLSIDTIITRNSPRKLSFIYNCFGLIKNLIVIITVLNTVDWKFTHFKGNILDLSKNFSHIFYDIMLKAMPLYSLKTLLFLPNAIALLKSTKNIQTLSISKRYFDNTEEDIGIFKTLKSINYYLIIFLFAYVLVTSTLAIICGFFINILIFPVIAGAILSFGFFLSFPIHLYTFLKDCYQKVKESRRVSQGGIFDDEDSRLIKYTEMLELTTFYYQFTFIIVLIVYISIAGQILIFSGFSWPISMEFYFSLPYLGFNVFAFDVKSKIRRFITTILILI